MVGAGIGPVGENQNSIHNVVTRFLRYLSHILQTREGGLLCVTDVGLLRVLENA